MTSFSRYLDALIKELTKLPGMGPKSASRIAFHLISLDPREVKNLADAMIVLRESIRECVICGGISDTEKCLVCSDLSRDLSLICVVETQKDALTIEKAGVFRGTYHVLRGVISPLDGIGPDDIRIDSLIDRCGDSVKDVLVALNPTMEGDMTTLYIAKILKEKGIRVSRIARGLPVGGDMEFADMATIARSISDSVLL